MMMMMLLQLLCRLMVMITINFSEWSVVLNANASDMSYKIDSGAQVNIFPKKEFYSLPNRPGLKDAKITYILQYSQSVTMYMHLQNANSKIENRWDKLNLKKPWQTLRI